MPVSGLLGSRAFLSKAEFCSSSWTNIERASTCHYLTYGLGLSKIVSLVDRVVQGKSVENLFGKRIDIRYRVV